MRLKQVWRSIYKDYKPDGKWIKEEVESGKGIIGCEMHELNGWGNNIHKHEIKKDGWIRTFLNLLFKKN
jgi:hypothetical protein